MQRRPGDPPRRRGLLLAAALALLLHAALLDGLDLGTEGAAGDDTPPPMRVRQLEAAPPAAAPAAAVLPAPVAAPRPVPAPRRPRLPAQPAPIVAAPEPAAAPASAPPAAPASAPAEAIAAAEPAPAPASEAASSAEPMLAAASAAEAPASAGAAPGSEPPPLYRVALPPAATLDYELRRGRLAGSGTLVWRPQGEHYTLRLDGSVVGLRVLTQSSEGSIDAHGLAPERFTDQRARRALQAANFRRDVGRITFSGPGTDYPLWPGVQDRLGWMMQLAGILQAEPAHRAAGERIVLQVVGARGDTAGWAFQVLGQTTLDTPEGMLPVLHLRREPRSAYDTRVEIWLDPARHHFPVKASMKSGEEEALELRLRQIVSGS